MIEEPMVIKVDKKIFCAVVILAVLLMLGVAGFNGYRNWESKTIEKAKIEGYNLALVQIVSTALSEGFVNINRFCIEPVGNSNSIAWLSGIN